MRPNRLRQLKTYAFERTVPLHPVLQDRLSSLPADGPLFPGLGVNDVTKAFTKLRAETRIDRPGVVFHSTRKWFITQCERTGVPEHFTASLVGHKSARSENKLTYGISDEQNGRSSIRSGCRDADHYFAWLAAYAQHRGLF